MATEKNRPRSYLRNWIKYTKGLPNRPEVRKMSVICPMNVQSLSEKRKLIVASCLEFWSWMDDETRDGRCDVTLDDVDDYVQLPGFAKAMCEVGWLTQTVAGIEVPRWEKHNGESAKKRILDAERKARERIVNNDVRDLSGNSTDENRTRAEKSRISLLPGASPLPADAAGWVDVKLDAIIPVLDLPSRQAKASRPVLASRLSAIVSHPQRDEWAAFWISWARDIVADATVKNRAAVLTARIGDDLAEHGVTFKNGKAVHNA